jgi:glycerophosphoryl diester phosphodiesterase
VTATTRLQIVAHRGWWTARDEQNTLAAFERALAAGYGIETDLWWRDGEVVISHDPPRESAIPLRDLVALYGAHQSAAPLALNAKCDALAGLNPRLLAPLAVGSWFFFDMSVPDMLAFRRASLPFFTRESELEPVPALYENAAGVWLDQFADDWVDEAVLSRHLHAGKAACIVSPELHGRAHEAAWQRYRDALTAVPGSAARVLLCTDFPQQAREFFAV